MSECTVQPKALVAEDDRALADIIRFALTRGGYGVSVFHDGEGALQVGQSETFDVVVSDYQMPGLNGEQLLSGLRHEGASRDAMLILCSAKAYELDSERLREKLALEAVFYKPFSLNELLTLIRSRQPAPPPRR